jgi:hypothetical protein
MPERICAIGRDGDAWSLNVSSRPSRSEAAAARCARPSSAASLESCRARGRDCLRLRATHPGLDGLAVALGEMVDRGLQPARATASMRVPRTDISARVTLSIRRADFVAITYSSPWPWIGRPTSFSKLSSPCAVSRKSIPSSAH